MGLTKEQKKAVSHAHGPVCVIAGAGTGKTTALVERMLYLIKQKGLKPERILVTTFTRKATAELYDHAYKRFGKKAQKLRISTIDALIWDLAQRLAHLELLRPSRLIDEAGRRLLLLHCAWEEFGQSNRKQNYQWRMNEKKYQHWWWAVYADERKLLNKLEQCIRTELSEAKQKKISTSDKPRKHRIGAKNWCIDPTQQELNYAVKRYLKKMEEFGAIDHDLLKKDFLHCLKQNKNIAKKFGSEYDAILVDEFQDTSLHQAEILLLLAGKRNNIWVVGDPCQQIYEWRGAEKENLLRFIKKTKSKEYHLTENWRSTQPILNAAYYFLSNRVSSPKKKRMLKRLKSMRDKNKQSDTMPVFTGSLDQALSFANNLLKNNNLKPKDIVILSSDLTKYTIKKIEYGAKKNDLNVQFASSRADRAMEKNIGDPPNWRSGKAIENLYNHRKIQKLISQSLRKRDFNSLRSIRPIASSAEAFDSTSPTTKVNF